MSTIISGDKNYKDWLAELKQKIQSAQMKAAVKVNYELLNLYWEMGKDIIEKQQQSNWGDSIIDQLSKDLSGAFRDMKGFSRSNLFFIRKWYLFYQSASDAAYYEKVSQLVRQIPWGHNREIIMKCKDITEAIFYVQETIKNNWSRSTLLVQIENSLFQRTGNAIHNFEETLPQPQADLAKETLKNPYNFDFLTIGKEAQEREIETALIDHIQKFLLELGQGFAYMGRQYHLIVAGDDFYLDLLFYHTKLRCYVVVELKTSEFRPEYVGKLNFYLNVVDDKLRHPQDLPTIGILLCKTPNKTVVEYSLKNISTPLGISEYQIIRSIPENFKGDLPTIEDLEKGMEGV